MSMGITEDRTTAAWNRMTYDEKNRALYERQKKLLDLFLEKNAISRQQYEKSLHDLTEKMDFRR